MLPGTSGICVATGTQYLFKPVIHLSVAGLPIVSFAKDVIAIPVTTANDVVLNN